MLTTSIVQFNPNVSSVISEKIEDFVQRVAAFSRNKLLSVYLYGAVTQEDFDIEYSSINALLVFDDVNTDLLEIVAPAANQAYKDFKLELSILSKEDIHSSTDVFPIEFADIKEKRFLIYGKDVFKRITVSFEDLRRSCELELKRYLFKLRSYFTLHIKTPDILLNKITEEFPLLLVNLNAAIYLKTDAFAPNTERIIEQASDEFKLDKKVLHKVRNIQLGRETVKDMIDIFHIYNKYLHVIVKMARAIDKFDVYK